jgi:hypothetical protein
MKKTMAIGLVSGIDIVPYNKTLLNPNVNGLSLYHGTTCRSECNTIAQDSILFLLQNMHTTPFS